MGISIPRRLDSNRFSKHKKTPVLTEFLAKLEQAGINEFIAEAQAQLDAYMG